MLSSGGRNLLLLAVGVTSEFSSSASRARRLSVHSARINMTVPPTMKKKDLFEAALVELKFATDPLCTENDAVTGREMLTNSPGPLGSFVFVVRRPG